MQRFLHVQQLAYFKGDRPMKRFCMVAVLTLTFAVSVSAGHIECGITDPPPPASGETGNGEIECGVTASVLAVLQGVLSAF